MKTILRNQIISYLILLFLLVINISESALVLMHDDILAIASTSDSLSNWVVILYGLILFGGFPLIAVVIALNRDDLQRLNVDRLYVLLLLVAGILAFYELPYNCFSGIAFIYLVYALLSKKIKLGVPDRSALRISLWIVGIFAITLLLINSSLNIPKIAQNLQYFVSELIPGSIFEEAFYRGLLFMFLKDMRLSESKIFYIQAFLFWISHINYLIQNPFTFWIFIPVLGLVLGYIVLRTRSIGVSTIAHVLVNVITVSLSLR